MCPLTPHTHVPKLWPFLRSLLHINHLRKTLCATPTTGVLSEATPYLTHCQVELPALVLTHSPCAHSSCVPGKRSKKTFPLLWVDLSLGLQSNTASLDFALHAFSLKDGRPLPWEVHSDFYFCGSSPPISSSCYNSIPLEHQGNFLFPDPSGHNHAPEQKPQIASLFSSC